MSIDVYSAACVMSEVSEVKHVRKPYLQDKFNSTFAVGLDVAQELYCRVWAASGMAGRQPRDSQRSATVTDRRRYV